MAGTDWQVYIMPGDPNQGSVWAGSYTERPTVEIEGSTIIITSNDDDEPVAIVSMMTALNVLVCREEHLKDDPRDRQMSETVQKMEEQIQGVPQTDES